MSFSINSQLGPNIDNNTLFQTTHIQRNEPPVVDLDRSHSTMDLAILPHTLPTPTVTLSHLIGLDILTNIYLEMKAKISACWEVVSEKIKKH
jgi:hypothetical protein